MATVKDHDLSRERKPTFGLGLLKGLRVTLKHLFKHNTVIQYPDEKQDLPARTRGVIALKEENCTVCMLCGRECPDWCIYIDSHKETLPPKREGGRPRKRNVLDRFAIDYALCMYCGICVEVCPYDALFWSREFEYAEYDIRELTHEKERLSDWMATVLPPPALEEGAELPGQPADKTTTTAGAQRPAGAATQPTPTASAAEARPQQAAEAPKAPTAAPTAPKTETTEEKAPSATAEVQQREEMEAAKAETDRPPAARPKVDAETGDTAPPPEARTKPAEPAITKPAEAPPAAPAEDPQQTYDQVLAEQLEAGSSPQVAQARAKVARVKAERGLRRTTTPAPVSQREPSAPTAGRPAGPQPSGAPEATEPQPEQGPVAPTGQEKAAPPVQGEVEGTTPSGASAETGPSEDPEAVYTRVLAEERAKGVSEAVAVGRAKAARIRAKKAAEH
jgi:formate hydrogenlyase subunit 6/NADH:ubiquinone oxidoreductase subunit I